MRRALLKEVRRKTRKGKTLDDVESITKTKYTRTVQKFFTANAFFKLRTLGSTMELDLCLCAYIEHLWQDGETKGLAGDTLSGLEYFIKPLRGKVRGAWRVFTASTKKELPNQAPPLPIGVMFALVGIFSTLDMVGVAAGIALGFH